MALDSFLAYIFFVLLGASLFWLAGESPMDEFVFNVPPLAVAKDDNDLEGMVKLWLGIGTTYVSCITAIAYTLPSKLDDDDSISWNVVFGTYSTFVSSSHSSFRRVSGVVQSFVHYCFLFLLSFSPKWTAPIWIMYGVHCIALPAYLILEDDAKESVFFTSTFSCCLNLFPLIFFILALVKLNDGDESSLTWIEVFSPLYGFMSLAVCVGGIAFIGVLCD